jgi:hypothetical protein
MGAARVLPPDHLEEVIRGPGIFFAPPSPRLHCIVPKCCTSAPKSLKTRLMSRFIIIFQLAGPDFYVVLHLKHHYLKHHYSFKVWIL